MHRCQFFDNLVVSHTPSQILEVNTYYPFGMLMQGSDMTFQSAIRDEWNGYKYNAKELQTELELGWLDYGARMLVPVLGRWWVPDPLAENRYNLSSYNYASNNPINRIDPNGMLDDEWKYNWTTEKWTWLSDLGGNNQQTVHVFENNKNEEEIKIGDASVTGEEVHVYKLRDGYVATNFDAKLNDKTYNINSGYNYSLRDFNTRNNYMKQGDGVFQRAMLGFESHGNAQPINPIEFDLHYGENAGLMRLYLYAQVGTLLADGTPQLNTSLKGLRNTGIASYRGYSAKNTNAG